MSVARHSCFLSALAGSLALFLFLIFLSVHAQDDPDTPDTPELIQHKNPTDIIWQSSIHTIHNHPQRDNHSEFEENGERRFSSALMLTADTLHVVLDPDLEDGGFLNNATLRIRARSKRQWGCPNGCFSPCSNNAHCKQRYQLATVCVLGCCCPAAAPPTNLSTACDGDAAVAACLNGLCGQGYFCNKRNFCCRCQSGTSPGECINNMCPAGYACNTNNYCCSIGSGSVLGQCVNGQCPIGYACGAGNLCYPVSGNGAPPLLSPPG